MEIMHFETPADLFLSVPHKLQPGASKFVGAKSRLDKLLREGDGMFLPQALLAPGGAFLDEFDFVNACLPFMEKVEAHSDMQWALVPRAFLMGPTYPPDMAKQLNEEEDSLAQHAAQHPGAVPDTRADSGMMPASPDFHWYPDLGVFFVHSMRRKVIRQYLTDSEFIFGAVNQWRYPEPTRIARYEVVLPGHNETWFVLDERWVQRVPLQAVTDDLLTAYGIAPAKPWPRRLPSPLLVARAFNPGNKGRMIDLADVGDRRAADAPRPAWSFWKTWWPHLIGIVALSVLAAMSVQAIRSAGKSVADPAQRADTHPQAPINKPALPHSMQSRLEGAQG